MPAAAKSFTLLVTCAAAFLRTLTSEVALLFNSGMMGCMMSKMALRCYWWAFCVCYVFLGRL